MSSESFRPPEISAEIGTRFRVPRGAEINVGYHEDSDSFRVTADFATLEIVGPLDHCALPVRLVLEDGSLGPEQLYYHIPEGCK